MSIEAIVGAGIGALGVVVAIYLYLLGRRYKAMQYAVVAQTRLVSAHAQVPDALQLSFKGAAVHDVRLLTVAIGNQGTQAIVPADFVEGPLKLTVRGKAAQDHPRVLTAEVRRPRPTDLRPEISVLGDGVAIQPLLLNRGDRFGVQMLTDAGEAFIALEGRLADVTKREYRPSRVGPVVGSLASGLVGVMGSLLLYAPFGSGEFFLLLGIAILGALALAVGVWVGRRRAAFTRDLLEKDDQNESERQLVAGRVTAASD